MQIEAIREGEERVKAQLVVANNADQRALNWSRLQIGSATAAFGVTLGFLAKVPPDYWLASISLIFGFLMVVAGWHAIQAARPDKLFDLPGNTPENWVPDTNMPQEKKSEIIERCRREQAECLTTQIAFNADIAKRRGEKMDCSYEWMKAALILALAGLLIIVTARSACSAKTDVCTLGHATHRADRNQEGKSYTRQAFPRL